MTSAAATAAAVNLSTDPDRIATARLLLDQLGVTIADLRDNNAPDAGATIPTLAAYLPRVMRIVQVMTPDRQYAGPARSPR